MPLGRNQYSSERGYHCGERGKEAGGKPAGLRRRAYLSVDRSNGIRSGMTAKGIFLNIQGSEVNARFLWPDNSMAMQSPRWRTYVHPSAPGMGDVQGQMGDGDAEQPAYWWDRTGSPYAIKSPVDEARKLDSTCTLTTIYSRRVEFAGSCARSADANSVGQGTCDDGISGQYAGCLLQRRGTMTLTSPLRDGWFD